MSTQFVVQLQNRPGALAAFARALAERGIDIHDIAGGGAGDHGYAVLSTDDDAATRAVRRSFGYPFVEGEALVVEIDDQPGGFAAVAEKLAAAGWTSTAYCSSDGAPASSRRPSPWTT